MLTLQDVADTFKSLTAWISILSFFFMSFMFQQFYSGGIISSLLSPTPKTIRDIPTLTESNLKIVVQNVPTSASQFLIGPDLTGKIIYNKKIKDIAPWVAVEEGVSYIRNGGYAFFGFVDPTYDIIKRTFPSYVIDELQEIHTDINLDFYMGIAKNSPYKEPCRVGVLKVKEYGLYDYIVANWTVSKPVGSADGSNTIELEIGRFTTLFYLLLLGLLVSLVFLGLEILVFKLNESRSMVNFSRIVIKCRRPINKNRLFFKSSRKVNNLFY